MPGNSFGNQFRITSFGESHGQLIGVVIDGCPAGTKIDIKAVQEQLDRRRPGQSKLTTQRKESDTVEFVSGIFEGLTTGTPLTAIIRNSDSRSKDYSHIAKSYRPSHADFTYDAKYGHRDYRGGGRSSARETACRVVAGAIARQILSSRAIHTRAYVSSVGNIELSKPYQELDLSKTDTQLVRCPDPEVASAMQKRIEEVKARGDSIGGTISCVITGLPPGLGEPVFDRFEADLAKAMLSLPATKGFEIGSGFSGTKMTGSEHNDPFVLSGTAVKTEKNNSGGVQGGITNGMDVYFRVAFKPVATIMKEQASLTSDKEPTTVQGRGRHDPCVLPRAVPIVEAMTSIVCLDHILRHQTTRLIENA